MADTNIMLGANLKLLGTELSAGFMKSGDDSIIYIYQSETAANEGITIAKLIADVETLTGKGKSGIDSTKIQESISGNVKDPSKINFDTIKIKLTTVYLKKTTKGTESTTEYAFRFDIDASDLLPKGVEAINITSLTLAVWNTKNEKILEKLALMAI